MSRPVRRRPSANAASSSSVPFIGRHFRFDGAAVEDMSHPVALGNGATDDTRGDADVPERAPDDTLFDWIIVPNESDESDESDSSIDRHSTRTKVVKGWATKCAEWSSKLERSKFTELTHKQLKGLRDDCEMTLDLYNKYCFDPEAGLVMIHNLGERYKKLNKRMKTMETILKKPRRLA